MRYWLLKSEPEVYGIADLCREQTTIWDGVRNYQARNFLQDMKKGDRAFFYHSNCKPPGIVGLMAVVAENIVDPSQFDPLNPYYDPKSSPDQPRWQTVKMAFLEQFPQPITLDILKATFSSESFGVVRRGNRLSVLPVESAIATQILSLGSSSYG